jgi:hypothetical protein
MIFVTHRHLKNSQKRSNKSFLCEFILAGPQNTHNKQQKRTQSKAPIVGIYVGYLYRRQC